MSDWTDEVRDRLLAPSTVSGTWGAPEDGPWCVKREADIRAALEEIEQGRKARVALQEALGSHNVGNPWLGICAAVALLQMGRKDAEAKLAEAERNAEAERSAKWARLDKAEAEVQRLRAVLERVLTEAGIQTHKHGCPNRLIHKAQWDEHKPCAGCEAEYALLRGGGE